MAYYHQVRKNKYGNKRIEIDGIQFDSVKEGSRYAELKLLEKAGEIYDLERQKTFVLQPAFTTDWGEKMQAITYKADFVYRLTKDGTRIIEDVKSPATRKDPVYRIKYKLMAYSGYQITEV